MIAWAASQAAVLTVSALRCESRVNPSGIETLTPRFSWEITSPVRNTRQTAYRILVSDDATMLAKNIGNVWDSKKTYSTASIQVAFAGKSLQAIRSYSWKVMIWDNHGQSSAWSLTATWQMGLLTTSDWKNARWITHEIMPDSIRNILPVDGQKDKIYLNNTLPLLRKSFSLKERVKKATFFISGLGHFELHVNGRKIGDHFLDPGWTKYDKEAQYVPFDLTSQLRPGENVLGVMLGNGFYYVPLVKQRYRKLKSAFGFPKMIGRLVIEYTSGRVENIVSDPSWKTAAGPITFSSIYGGEDYNANLEQNGWDAPSFNDRTWTAALLTDGPPRLYAQQQEPLRIFENFAPAKSTKLASGDWVFDLGQNASGIVKIQVKGNKGDTVRIVPAELLKEDGNVNQRPVGSPFYFEYVLKGEGVETWQPRFTYYGFRYLQVKGAMPGGQPNPSRKAEVLAVTGLHIRNAAERAGNFASSSDLFNRTGKLIDWAVKSNIVSVFTDCPHREKLGWLEEVHLVGPSVRYNYDIETLCRKTISDMISSQTADGLVPGIAPEYVKFEWGGDMFRDSPEWGSSSILVPWYTYQWYGDSRVLRDSYAMMQRYIAYLGTKAKNNILSQGLGDWYDLGPKPPGVSQLTPMGVTGTAMYYYDLKVLCEIAALLGKSNDVSLYSQLAEKVRKSFNDTFFNSETKQYATGSQTANAMAIYMQLVNPADKAAVMDNLVKEIRSHNNSLTAGDIGYRYLLRVLEQEGRSDVIFDMNNRDDVPGYGYQLAKGATALTESWQALPTVSNNHLMLGHVMEWFYSGLAGIRPAAGSIAFNRIHIQPEVVGDISSAHGSYHSPYGMISSDWKRDDVTFELNVTIPPNTLATIYLPAGENDNIQENGKSLAGTRGLEVLKNENGRTAIKTGSGIYHFVVTKK
ncbi:family 78 glycoside hydrolase catalytic domain [Pedobacter sp. HMF7056]|uniref:alpha-L-rhamnosidase n=1 Tax=Hufsiella ginkgonis TaxID=2695274 RepID=A0A7K1XWM6_9SPHI|nr:family 78 glycoside hydrolase catalytic domain [Hufsiella ginkgonis]